MADEPGRSAPWRVGESAARVQAPGQATDSPQRRAQHRASGGEAAELPAGVEGVLRTGANPARVAQAGRVDTTPATDSAPQAMATWQDGLPGAAPPRSQPFGGTLGGGAEPPLVAQQSFRPAQRADHRLLRPAVRTASVLIS